MLTLCIRCDSGVHTVNPHWTTVCNCRLTSCGCYKKRVDIDVMHGGKDKK